MGDLIQKARFGHTKQKVPRNSIRTLSRPSSHSIGSENIAGRSTRANMISMFLSLFLTRGDQLNILALSAPADAAQCLFLPVLAQHGVSWAH